ncbi:DUF4132 domain-containing protein [Phytomonospora endophytica]|uniref:DUF4132 domain-containing protein n=1 Tax=Phytomonospora endophytica TaxID=714109 RepID=A0A841FDQ2_9ACTN|nr:DUF4132 domain-containing protein [Phytomonospora endophytica]MBB6033944.1 hypothetical protein [Phytomonospora endophytica]GIG64535.1 hypothetical protein Pen01_08300 [Phytomonospora endophytica]
MTDATVPEWAPTTADEWGTVIRERLTASVPGGLAELGAHLATLGGAFTKRRELKKAWLGKVARLLVPGTHDFVLGAVAALADGADRRVLIGTENRDLAMGFVVAAGLSARTDAVPVLTRLARRAGSLHGTGMLGRDDGFAQVALYALADLAVPESIDALCRLRREVSYVILHEKVTEVLGGAAAAQGVSEEDWTERSVPAWGVGPEGVATLRALGEGTVYGSSPYPAEITVEGAFDVTLTWHDTDGSVKVTDHPFPSPTGFKRRFGSHNVEATQRAAKRVLAGLATERHRVGRLSRTRTWDCRDWRRLYLDHPLTGPVARAVIWEFTDGDGRVVSAIPVADGGYDSVGAPPAAPVEVRLWDSARAGAEETALWRKHLADGGLRPAFDQLP